MNGDRPFIWIDNGTGRRVRWYPDEYVEKMTLDIGAYASGAGVPDFDPELLDEDQCRACVPALRAGLEQLTRFVTMVENRANGISAAVCVECGSRFYPSRSDARYCGNACRMRASRRRRGAPAAPPRPAAEASS